MLKQKVYEGYWWLPDLPDHKIPGRVEIDDDQHVTLSTLGSLVEMATFEDAQLDTITGITEDGKYLTLLDCSNDSFRRSFPGIDKQNYRVRVLAVGIMLEASQNLPLKSLSFRCTDLEAWIGEDNFSIKHNQGLSEIDIKYCQPTQSKVNLPNGYKLKISFTNEGLSYYFPQTEVKIKEKAWITIEPPQEEDLDTLLQIINHLRNFLSLVVGQPVYLTQMIGTSELAKKRIDDQEYYESIEFCLSGLDQPTKKHKYINHSTKLLLPLNAIEEEVELILRAWFNCQETIKPSLNLYFGTLYEEIMNLERDFLFLAQAVETYHRRTSSETDFTEEKHEVRLQKILDSVPSEYKSWLEGKLKYSNELSLRKRIKILIDRFSDVLGNYIQRKHFTNKVVNTRNYLTHYDPELENSAAKGTADFLDLIYKLHTILEVCFLSELQLSDEKIAAVMEKKIQERQRIVEMNRK